MENRKIVDFVISQYEQIQGELIIQEVFARDLDDKILEIMNTKGNTSLGDIFREIACFQELGKEKTDLVCRLEYLKGMMEAYTKIIQKIKDEEN